MGVTPLHFRMGVGWPGRYAVLMGVLGFCICVQLTDVMAQEMNCIGTLGEIETRQLRVSRGRTCLLRGAIVKGNVMVERNAILRTYDVRVYGRIIPNRLKLSRFAIY